MNLQPINPVLFYVHDPMCSWCWAFRPVLINLRKQLPNSIQWHSLLGGLAKDSSEPMSDNTRQFVQGQWHKIQQQVPDTTFNFEFWTTCKPRRSTYPACRAVIAAREQEKEYEDKMVFAIQQAYYLQARNPSDTATLLELACEIGLDSDQFSKSLTDDATYKTLEEEIRQGRAMGLNSFPSLLLKMGEHKHQITIDYMNAETIVIEIMRMMEGQ